MIRSSVFGSGSERELFTRIQSQWGNQFDVYPSLPFASVIDIRLLDLTDEERRFLYSTNVDYTLCTKEGQPLMSVEFDGFSRGYSRRGQYVQMRVVEDSRRGWKLDLKVRVATQVQFPFFIVSYEEKNPISERTHLTILDGIIGQALAHRDLSERGLARIQELLDSTSTEIMPPDERSEFVQELVIDAEVDAEMRWDPIAREAAKLNLQVWKRRILRSWDSRFVNDPELPDGNPLEDPDALKRRLETLDDARRVGCKVTLHTVFGDVQKTAWLRNFEYAEVGPLSLAENIAMILACTDVLEVADRRTESGRP